MEIETRLAKLQEHIANHPHDYQAVIAAVKLHSDQIEHARYIERIERLKHIAGIRKARNEKRRQRDGDGGRHAEVDSPTRGS